MTSSHLSIISSTNENGGILGLGEGEIDGDTDGLLEEETDGLALGDMDGETDGDIENDCDDEVLGLLLGETDRDKENDIDGDILKLWEGEILGEPEKLTEGDRLGLPLRDIEGEEEKLREGDIDGDIDAEVRSISVSTNFIFSALFVSQTGPRGRMGDLEASSVNALVLFVKYPRTSKSDDVPVI
jgi:hypothetical protein